MLAYSDEWRAAGAQLAVGDACSLPFLDGTVDVLVVSLGDSYNLPAFWHEAARVLRLGGRAFFTTPAPEWTRRFRAPDQQEAAEFVRRDGAVLLVPSLVSTEEDQVAMFAEAGLGLIELQAFSVADLQSPPAPKLLCVEERIPVLRGYVVCR
jgi:SAM-dependent methyltransferase